MGGGGRDFPPKRVGAPFVPPPPPARCHRMYAEAFKECLDAYLEGLIAGGADLFARLLERKARDHDSDDHRAGRTPSFASKAGVNLCPPRATPCAAGGDSSLPCVSRWDEDRALHPREGSGLRQPRRQRQQRRQSAHVIHPVDKAH